ncbi:K02A2.6-like [Cordylochernes scorpioides]|uniref:K02A2.6-like n=1 Tax=Cordylochernes scorpioides TaxID=51811 RepID=A0ABY6KMZ6_9ARAC|nr:K02A2.6-like [Cordylochernes scorpioides]
MANYIQVAAPEGFNFGKPNEWPIWFKRFQRYRIASGTFRESENEQKKSRRDGTCRGIHNQSLRAGRNLQPMVALKEEMIRDRLVVGVKNFNLSEKLQLESELTLEKAIPDRKKGHFAKVCHTKTVQEVSSSQNYAFIGIVGMQENAEDKWCEVIKVNDQPIKFKIDTGAETEKADKNLFAVSKKIEVNGMFQAFLESKRQKCEETIYIVKGKRMGQILEGLEGTLCHMDDIMVYGSCQEEHDKRLETVLTRVSKSGLTLNKEKCKFAVTTIKFLGHQIGAVIWQTKDGLRQVIAYASRMLSETEKRYAQIEKEALAITWACEKFKQYIQGLVITLETDHKPLVPIFTSKNIDDLTPRIQRLRLRIMRYSYKIVHTPGKNLIVADALSRSPRTKVGTQELEEELCAYVQQVVSFMPISDVPRPNYLLIADYYSRYPEIARLEDMTISFRNSPLKVHLCKTRIPLEVRSDNGPQFGLLFKEFAPLE